jgi:hypothetical protein
MKESLLPPYETLSTLNIELYPKGSFLNWSNNYSKREDILRGNTELETIRKIAKKYPNVQVIRGADYGIPLGENGDFFVGNVVSASRFALNSYRGSREQPTILTIPIQRLISSVENRQLFIDSYEGGIEKLLYDGVIYLSLAQENDLGYFQPINLPLILAQ